MTIKYASAPPAARGRPRLAVSEKERARIYRLYVVEELAVRDVAARLRIPEANVRRRMKAAGIEARPNVPRSRLRRTNQARLFSNIVLLGIERTAKRYRMTKRALQFYLAGLRRKAKEKE